MASGHISPTKLLHQCQHCGSGFYPKRTDRLTFCSQQCSLTNQKAKRLSQDELKRRLAERQAARRVVLQPLPCKQCSKVFLPNSVNHALCSSECRVLWSRSAAVGYAIAGDARDRTPRPCGECGKVFAPEYGNKKRAFCSDACGRKSKRRTARKVGKARKRAATVEYVNPTKVFDRDGWRCQLCGCSTPRRLRGTLVNRAPELDHIIPLAAGGEHSYRNTQCACRACNIAKGARPLGQMRLIA
jgi:5-methylcytosine-specific restriction endonuclease McrA